MLMKVPSYLPYFPKLLMDRTMPGKIPRMTYLCNTLCYIGLLNTLSTKEAPKIELAKSDLSKSEIFTLKQNIALLDRV